MTDALRRFARTLVQRLGETPGGPHRAVTVEELRSRLLPYRAYRSVLGFESVEDYDVVVMRLVGEEEGFVRTLPQLAAERCRAETEGPAPNPELLDQLADVTIQVGAESLGRILDESVQAPVRTPVRDDLDIIERHLELEVREPVESSPVVARPRAPVPAQQSPSPQPAPPLPPPPPEPVPSPVPPPTPPAPEPPPATVHSPAPEPPPAPEPSPAPELPPAPAPPPIPAPPPVTEVRPVPPKPQLKPRRPLAPPKPANRATAVAPDAPSPEPAPAPAEPDSAPVESAGPAEVAESPSPPRVEPPSPVQETARMAQPAATATATCRSCRQSLPGGRQVVFCPWCGERLVPFSCPECHTELDAQWKHCITCGAPVKNPPRSP
jgi:hypothetical protein